MGVETVVKEENAAYQHFLLLSRCFQRLFLKVAKISDCAVKGKPCFVNTVFIFYEHNDSSSRSSNPYFCCLLYPVCIPRWWVFSNPIQKKKKKILSAHIFDILILHGYFYQPIFDIVLKSVRN